MSLDWLYTGSPDFSRGHHVLAFSQPLWVIVLCAAFSLGARLAVTAIALQFVLFVGGVLILVECHRRTRLSARTPTQLLGDSAKIAAVAALLAVSNSFREFMTSGLEFALVFFLVALVALLFLHLSGQDRGPATIRTAGFCCALLILARFDMTWALLPAAVATLWSLRRSKGRIWGSLAAGLSPLVLWLAYAWIHFGTIISARPDNFVLRGLPRSAVLTHGELYIAGAIVQDPFTFLLLALALVAGVTALRASRKNHVPLLMALGALTLLASIVWQGGDTVGGRMLCPVACLAAAALAAAPAFRVRSYVFAGCYVLVFFDIGRISLWRGSESRRPRTVELLREWGVTDEYAARNSRLEPDALDRMTAATWRAELRRPRSSDPRILTATPGLEGILAGPGREVEDWRSLGPAKPELDGTIAVGVRFAPVSAGIVEPVLSFGDPLTGTALLAEHLPGGGLRFRIWRRGEMPIFSQAVRKLDTGAIHRLVVHYGARAAGSESKGMFGVTMDGVRLKNYPCALRRYDSSEIVAGWNTVNAPECLQKFSGEIVSLSTAGESEVLAGAWPLLVPARTLVDLRVRFSRIGDSNEPVFVTGREKARDIVFVRRLDKGRVVFGVEHSGEAPFFGHELDIDDGAEHRLTIALGPLFAHSDALVRPDCIRVTLDGRVALETREEPYPFAPEEAYALDNPLGASLAGRNFLGEVISVSPRSTEPALVSVKSMVESGTGPVSMRLRFDGSSRAWGLGLLEAGEPGAGCIAYVVNVDSTHVRFYLDHWGGAALSGLPVKVDRTRAYDLKIEMGALNDPGDSEPGASDNVRYKLDGKVVLEGISYWPPAGHVPVYLLDNIFKSSNVSIPFDGTCISIARGGAKVDLPN